MYFSKNFVPIALVALLGLASIAAGLPSVSASADQLSMCYPAYTKCSVLLSLS